MATTQELLRRINFIEVDLEIQKQILFSIPSDQKEEMEKIIKIIAEKKAEIAGLRQQIATQDPEEHQRILRFEEASARFRQMAQDKTFVSIYSASPGEPCKLEMANGSFISCLIKACDSAGNWTTVDFEGTIEEHSGTSVAEEPDLNSNTAGYN